ncbi:MAG: patatin-like phospholipase family protein, partial [Flavobacteriales bacterium]
GKFICGYVSLNTGEFHSRLHTEFNSDEDFAKAVEASTAIPLVWEPVNVVNHEKGSDQQLVDGGVRDVSPLGSVIHLMDENPGAENIMVVINCSSGMNKTEDYKDKNIAQLALRSLNDIAISEIFDNDLKEFIDKNYILEQVRKVNPDLQIYDFNYRTGEQGKPLNRFKAIIINPDPHVLGDSLVANEKLIKRRLMHGYDKAAHAFGEYLKQDEDRDFVLC